MPETWGEALAAFGLLAGILGVVWHFAHVHLTVLRTGRLVEKELLPNEGNSLKDRVDLLGLAYHNQEQTSEGIDRRLESIDACIGRLREATEARVDAVEQENAAIWRSLAEHGLGRRSDDRGGG